MPEQSRNVWAPWRMEYIESIGDTRTGGGCFLCAYRDAPESDATHLVARRGPRHMILMNRFPYTGGHVLIAPLGHVGRPEDLDAESWSECTLAIRDAVAALRRAVRAEGFNIGINLGHCAGAGLPDHLHWHVVPRWSGDTNYMAVVGDVRVIPQALQATYERFVEALAAPPA